MSLVNPLELDINYLMHKHQILVNALFKLHKELYYIEKSIRELSKYCKQVRFLSYRDGKEVITQLFELKRITFDEDHWITTEFIYNGTLQTHNEYPYFISNNTNHTTITR